MFHRASSNAFSLRSFHFLIFASACVLLPDNQAVQGETWTDMSGKHSIEAKFIAIKDDEVLLRRKNGKQLRIALSKLDHTSRIRAERLAGTKPAKPSQSIAALISNARELESLASQQRTAVRGLRFYEDFLARDDLTAEDQESAKKKLKTWYQRAEADQFRWANRWEEIEKIQQRLKDEERLLKEAHRLIEIGNDMMARERFEEASETNPEGVRGDFYLGILHALIGKHAKDAEKRFSICVNRLQKAKDRLTGARRSNLIAALNNRAICRVRIGQHKQALGDWDKAIRLAHLTPELVQNLGYYAKLASVVPGWQVSRAASRRASDLYAKLTVANQSDEFHKHVGWLFIPYVDAPTLPDFENVELVKNRGQKDAENLADPGGHAEDDLRIIGWATGVAVDRDHLLTARRSVQDSRGLWIRRDGQVRRDLAGKVVAVSGSYDLALVRFRDLGAEVIPFETKESTRATDIRVLSFAEPGILEDGPQKTEGTIVDLRTVYVPLGKQYLTRVVQASSFEVDEKHAVGESTTLMETTAVPIGREHVTGLIHDAFVNQGGTGAPLFNLDGKIIGIDLAGFQPRKSSQSGRQAVNHTEVRSFLASTGMNFPAIDEVPTGVIEDIEDYVLSAAESAIFQLAIVGRVPRLSWTERIGKIRNIQKMREWNAFEDDWCIRCNGTGEITCPYKGCVKGYISHKERYIKERLPVTNTPVYEYEWIRERCPGCHANGNVTCPHCHGKKLEPSL